MDITQKTHGESLCYRIFISAFGKKLGSLPLLPLLDKHGLPGTKKWRCAPAGRHRKVALKHRTPAMHEGTPWGARDGVTRPRAQGSLSRLSTGSQTRDENQCPAAGS